MFSSTREIQDLIEKGYSIRGNIAKELFDLEKR